MRENVVHIDKVLCGDSLSLLRGFSDDLIDLGITSPPYNKQEKHQGWLVKNVKYSGSSDVRSESEYQQEQIEILDEIYRITKAGGSFFYNHKTRWDRGEMYHPIQWLYKTKWLIKQEIIWDRMIAANIRGWRFWQVDERIYWLYKPLCDNKIGVELESKHALLSSIWRFPPERGNPHPAPFPITLPTRIITSILNENDGIVLDPYCGSGTTLIAAKLLNKQYIGIDISPEYAAYTEKRLENSISEQQYVIEELAKHKVEKTFKQRKEQGEFTGKYKNISAEQKNIDDKSLF
jgi:modification methylase